MKLAAVHALAKLAKEPVPDLVFRAYGTENIQFGREYLIPKPLDPRLITTVAPAVAKAAMDSGMAAAPITDWVRYERDLLKRIGINQKVTSRLIDRATKNPKRVVFANADNYKILKAAQEIFDGRIGFPILLGNKERIQSLAEQHKVDIENLTIIDPAEEKELLQELDRKSTRLNSSH